MLAAVSAASLWKSGEGGREWWFEWLVIEKGRDNMQPTEYVLVEFRSGDAGVDALDDLLRDDDRFHMLCVCVGVRGYR